MSTFSMPIGRVPFREIPIKKEKEVARAITNNGGRKYLFEEKQRKEIAARLVKLRGSLRQVYMAEKIGLFKSTMCNVERGLSITEANIEKYCSALNLRREWLVDGMGDQYVTDEPKREIKEVKPENGMASTFDQAMFDRAMSASMPAFEAPSAPARSLAEVRAEQSKEYEAFTSALAQPAVPFRITEIEYRETRKRGGGFAEATACVRAQLSGDKDPDEAYDELVGWVQRHIDKEIDTLAEQKAQLFGQVALKREELRTVIGEIERLATIAVSLADGISIAAEAHT